MNTMTTHPFNRRGAVSVVDFWAAAGLRCGSPRTMASTVSFASASPAGTSPAARGDLAHWLADPEAALAPRCCLTSTRATPSATRRAMYDTDAAARTPTAEAIAGGHDRRVPLDLAVFFYLPFGHSEVARGSGKVRHPGGAARRAPCVAGPASSRPRRPLPRGHRKLHVREQPERQMNGKVELEAAIASTSRHVVVHPAFSIVATCTACARRRPPVRLCFEGWRRWARSPAREDGQPSVWLRGRRGRRWSGSWRHRRLCRLARCTGTVNARPHYLQKL